MNETRYMISDAAKKIDVESHVLRYWEEELELGISRTELGHRYYTEEDIRVFQNIKELKERGIQLKAIKVLIPELNKRTALPVPKEPDSALATDHDLDRLQQFGNIVSNIFKQMLLDNNEELEGRITDTLRKEMNMLMQLREEREEERYRRLDETIRAHQKKRQLVAATKEKGTEDKKRWFGIF